MTIDKLSEDRKELRQQLIDNKLMDGFKNLLTLLYSDKVHFIYELLQNAEDARATEVQFVLNADRLEFEHNGDQTVYDRRCGIYNQYRFQSRKRR